jgi:hypothetical protein
LPKSGWQAARLLYNRFFSWFRDFKISVFVLILGRWQMIAGESQDSLEESPNTIRQHAA